MKVLVTGAAGRLGRQAVQTLHAAGLDVRATDVRYAKLPISLELADLLDRFVPYRLLEGCDALVHLANHPNVSERVPDAQTYSDNVTMTGNLLMAACEVGVRRIVYASSIQVIAGDRTVVQPDHASCLPYLPLDGDLPRQPGNVYALSKVAGEQLLEHLCARHPDLAATAIRFPALRETELDRDIRGWQRRHPLAERRRMMAKWSKIDEGFSYLLMTDAADLILAALRRQSPGYHQYLPAAVDNTLGVAVEEVVAMYYAHVPLRRPGEALESLVDTSRITDELGWAPTPPPADAAEPKAA